MRNRKAWLAMLFGAVLLSAFLCGCGHKKDEDPDKLLKTILAELDAYAVTAMKDWEVPGMAVAIVRGDEVLFMKAYGVKQKGGSDPVTVNTLFQIGSTSKAFTTALMAMDVDRGRYKWTDKVIDHLPDFQMFDPWVTQQFEVVDLSAQRSGMPSYAADGVMVLGYDREHIRQVIRYVEPAYSFRSEGSYVNNLFQVDAELIEKYSGMNWEDNVRERIFKPLGMTHSSVDMNSFVSAPNVINLHHWIGSQVVMLPMDWKLQNWPYVGGPAGGVNSTVVDLVNWVRLHFNNGSLNGQQLISEKNAIFVHTPQTPSKYHAGQPMSYYCQGWMYRESSPYAIIWHNGESSGIKSAISFIPQEKLGVVVLTNLEGTKVPEALSWRFYDLYFGNELRDWSAEELEKTRKARADAEANRPQPPPDPEPPLPLDDYAGTYYNPVYLEVEVERRLDQLVVTIGPLQTEILMRPWDGNTFMGSWDVFTEFEDVGFVTFTLDPGGAPVDMAIDYLNYDGCGVFERI